MELLRDSDSSSVAIGPHWPSSYPEYLSPHQDKSEQQRVVWARLQANVPTWLANSLSRTNDTEPYAKNSIQERLESSQATIRCIVTPNYSKIARPLLDLTKKATLWQWTDCHFKAFEELKMCMCQQSVLIQPNFQKCFYLQVDASAYGLGAILSQEGTSSPTLAKSSKPVLHP